MRRPSGAGSAIAVTSSRCCRSCVRTWIAGAIRREYPVAMGVKAVMTGPRRLLAAGQPPMARRVFEDIHAHDPDEPEALNALAVGALRIAEPARAMALLTRRLERAPDDAVAR